MNPEYPHGFPQECQARVEVAKLRASRDCGLTGQIQELPFPELERRALRWVCIVLGVFAQEACELGKAGKWSVVQIRKAVEEYRLQLVRSAHFDLSHERFGWVDHVFGTSIRTEVRYGIENSEEWRHYQGQLLEVAEAKLVESQSPVIPARSGNGQESESPLSCPEIEPSADALYSDSDAARQQAVTAYTQAWSCSEASLARTAVVNPADLSKWKKGSLPLESDKKARIERVLKQNQPPRLASSRNSND
jgi:hypothetical protein